MGIKRYILGIAFVVFLLSFNDVVNPLALEDKSQLVPQEQITLEEQVPQYVPGEIIVKLREKEGAEVLFSQSYSTRKSKHENILHGLKTKYRLKDEKPIFKGLHKQLEARDFSQNQLREEIETKSFSQHSRTYKFKKQTDLLPIYLLNTDEDVLAVCNQLSQDPEVEYVQPNYIYEISMIPNDPYYYSSGSWGQNYDDLWGLKKIQCEDAWDISQGEGVVVTVIDTGVDYNHEELWDNIWVNPDVIADVNGDGEINLDDCDLNGNKIIEEDEIFEHMFGWDFAYGDNNPMDGDGHGTHCAGTIAAIGNNALGVVGIAPKSKIMPVKGLNDEGSGSTSILAECIRYAASNGAMVLSNSWGPRDRLPSSPTLENAIDDAYNAGCVVVFSAGNNDDDVAYYSPANYSKTIAVAASTQNDEKCYFSNYGSLIDVSAPGGGYKNELGTGGNDVYNILSTMPDDSTIGIERPSLKVSDGYWRLAGTSMACPHVAGVAALVISKNLELSNEEVRQRIQFLSNDIGGPGRDEYFGYGRINSYLAVAVDDFKLSITFPTSQSYMEGSIDILGSAFIEPGFQSYELYYTPKDSPGEFTLITSSTAPVIDGLLGVWDTLQCSDGEYVLTLKVVDIYGKEFSYSISLQVKNIKLYMASPLDGSFLRGEIQVTGTAFVGGFQSYELYYTPKDSPGEFTLITSSTAPVIDGLLGVWDTLQCSDGEYVLALKVFDINNKEFTCSGSITVDNINQLPVFNLINKVAIIDRLLEFKVEAQDPDDPETSWGELIYSAGNLPSGATFDPETQIFSWIPTEYDKGSYEVAFTVRDSEYTVTQNIILSTIWIEEIPICAASSDQTNPAIYEDRIVWGDNRSSYSQIYIYDLSVNQESQITSRHNYKHEQPSIYKDKIVWTSTDFSSPFPPTPPPPIPPSPPSSASSVPLDMLEKASDNNTYRFGRSDIYMYDLSTQEEIPICTASDDQYSPCIYGDKIVWADERNRLWPDIYMYDLTKKEETPITNASRYQLLPAIYEDKIVWQDMDAYWGTWDIFMYDLTIKEEIPICAASFAQTNPAIYEDKIVWEDGRNGNYDIYMIYAPLRDLKIQITTDLNDQGQPAIYEDRIVWQDYRNGNLDIYMYDLSVSQEIQITTDLNDQGQPAIYEDIIVWQDYRNRNWDIYMARVIFAPEIVSISSTRVLPSGTLIIAGKNFGYNQENSTVEFEDGTVCPVGIWSNSEITCVVPENASTGLLRVVTEGGPSNGIIVTVNYPSVLNPIGNKTANVDDLFQFTITATDPDGDILTYGATNLPDGATLDSYTGEFSWTPEYVQIGTHEVTFTVSDGELTDSETINIEVTAPLPRIKLVSPRAGFPGRYVRIRGRDFGPRLGSSRVEFSSQGESKDAEIFYWRDNYIICIVPQFKEGAYKVKVINLAGKSNSEFFRVLKRPHRHWFWWRWGW